MKNAAPGLLMQTGQTLSQTGDASTKLGNTIADATQATMDDAMTRASETQFLRGAQDILNNPQSGYLNTRGMNAQTQAPAAQSALDKVISDARAKLTNPYQQRQFDLIANDHAQAITKQMWDHQHDQVTQFAIQNAQDGADSLSIQASDAYLKGDMAGYQKNMARVSEAVMQVAQLNGAAPESDVAQKMLRAKRTDLVQSITIRLLDNHQYSEAKQYFDSQQDNIDMRTADTLGNAVKTEYDRNLTETKGDGYLAAAQSGTSSHPDQYMATPNPKGVVERGNLPIWNRPIVKNADGTVSSEYSTSFQDDQGREVLVPTVVNGKFLTPDGTKPPEGSAAEKTMFQSAWNHYLQTGENLGKFDNADDADAYAQQLHSRPVASAAAVPYTYGSLATGSTINPMKITDVPGSPRPEGRTHDGYDIAMPSGTAITAPTDGKVVKVWNDDQFGGGLSMRVQLADGNTLGVAHLSAANLQEGESVNKGQVIALSGKTGNATGNVLHVALQDPDGQYIDYFGASKAQPDPAGNADPGVLQRAIDMAKGDDSLDPYQQKQVVRYMESEHSKERAIQEQQYQEVKQQAVDALVQNGGNYAALPAAIRTQLRPSDAMALNGDARNMTEQEQKQAEVPVLANWLENPQQQTPAAVNEAYVKGQLTQGSYLTSLKEAQRLQSDPQKVKQASLDHDQLTDILAVNQMPNLAQPKSNDDRLQRVELETAIKSEIASQQGKANRELTFQEKGKVARDMVIDKVYTSGMNNTGGLKPVSILTPDEQQNATVWLGNQKVRMMDVPAQFSVRAMQDLQTNGLPTTQANIAGMWLRQGKPKQ